MGAHTFDVLDLHTHVWAHRPGTPIPTIDQLQAYCQAAQSRGIAEIAITEHSYRFDRIIEQVLPSWDRPATGAVAAATAHIIDAERGADLERYIEALAAAKDEGLPILVGLEVDYLPGAMEHMAAVLADYPFDVLLGSVHWLDEWLFDAYDNDAFARRWLERDVDDVFEQYVDCVLDLARHNIVDVLAHVDVIKVAGHRAPRLAEIEARLVEGIASSDVVIEFSSGGLRKPVGDTYPGGRLLDDLVSAGVPLTTASDAHTVDQIGSDFDVLERELDRLGQTHLATFRQRRRVPYRRGSAPV